MAVVTAPTEAALIAAAHTYREARAAYLTARDIEEAFHEAYVNLSRANPLERLLDKSAALRKAAEASKVASAAIARVEAAREALLVAAEQD